MALLECVYLNVLPKLVSDYNNAIHSTIKMTPKEASQKSNERRVRRNVYGIMEPHTRTKTKFNVGDKVRISKYKNTFKKGLTVRTSLVLFSSLVNAQCFCFVSFDFSMVSANQYFRDCPTWHVVMASSSQSLTSDNYDVLWLRRKF